jgi:hypothetical protein
LSALVEPYTLTISNDSELWRSWAPTHDSKAGLIGPYWFVIGFSKLLIT